ncbi:MAG: hypothetical protein ACXQTD_00125 [Candidatus Syntropharchaeia archaeon]
MKGYELAKKYRVTILGQSMFLECDEMCVCGHHISEHYGEGTAGGCRGCGHDKMPYRPFCHNFTPMHPRVMNYKDYKKAMDTGYFKETKIDSDSALKNTENREMSTDMRGKKNVQNR